MLRNLDEFDEFDNVDDFLSGKSKKIYEGLGNEELVKELRDGASRIMIEPNGKYWGVTYWKDGVRKTEGQFETNPQVHEFLIAHDIDYEGKTGYEYMRKFRGKDSKLYYRNFIY